VTWKYC